MEINDNQKIKIVFTGGITVLGGVRIYIDGNKIAKLKNKQEIETYVTPGQHKLNLKDFRFVNSDYILNISTEIKTIYIDLGYYIFGLYTMVYPNIKNVRIEKNDLQQSDLVEDNGTIVKQIKPIVILSFLSLIMSLLGYYFEIIPLEILSIVFGIIGYRKEGYNIFARLAAVGGIIYGVGATLNTLLHMIS